MPATELRHSSTPNLDITRANGSASSMRLVGYAAVFNQTTRLLPFDERIEPDAFAPALRNPDITLNYQHDDDLALLGRTTSGTLKLSQDNRGLRVVADLPDTAIGHHFAELVRRRDLSGMSFRFGDVTDRWEKNGSRRLRIISAIGVLADVTLAVRPAYPQTTASVGNRSRSLSHARRRELELLKRRHPPNVVV